MKHFGFPSIEQFRHTVKIVRDRCSFDNLPLPVITFKGTVKLHGTNAGVVKDLDTGEMWAQSREQLITPEQDNAGFARFVTDNGITFQNLFKIAQDLSKLRDDPVGSTHLAIFGEWCGQGIMKGVAINQLPKRFVIFGVRVIVDGPEQQLRWFTPEEVVSLYERFVESNDHNDKIFCIYNFQSWKIDIDFARPEETVNVLVDLTKSVEVECPVGRAFGVSGIGEGIVWKAEETWGQKLRVDDLIFKVKGEKHSDTKVTKTVEVDVEKVRNAKAFATAVVTDHRLEKMVEKLKEAGTEVDIKNTGAFLKLVGNDVIKEETDRLTVSGLEWKDVANAVNQEAKQWWMKLVTAL